MNLTRLPDLGITGTFTSYLGMGALVVLASAVVWVLLRTQSMHLITSRLWLLLNGRKLPKHVRMETFFHHQNALMLFRFTTSVRARTLQIAVALMNWCDKHNEDIEDVARCGKLFDVEGLKLLSTGMKAGSVRVYKRAKDVMGAVATVILVLCAMNTESALFTMTDSKQWFVLSQESARAAKRKVKPVTLADCSSAADRDKVADKSGFIRRDIDHVCALLAHPDKAEFRQKALFQQRVALFLFGSLFLVFAVACRREERCLAAYFGMKQRLEDRAKEPPTPRRSRAKSSKASAASVLSGSEPSMGREEAPAS